MGFSDILVLSLIGVGAFACVCALIWTKLIKPVEMSYVSTSYVAKRKTKSLIKQLFKEGKLSKIMRDPSFKSTDSYIILDYLVFGNDKVYAISQSMYWNIASVKFAGSKFEVTTKKGKTLDLPLEISLFEASAKSFRKFFETKDKLEVIIPCLNKEFQYYKHNNLNFVQVDKVKQFIIDNETSQENQIKELQDKISSAKIKRKPKRTILPKTTKNIDFN